MAGCEPEKGVNMAIRLTYWGHSCFVISNQGYRVAIDPYDALPGYEPLKIVAEEVVCSHGHMDHAYVDAVRIARNDRPSPFKITTYDVPHDEAGGRLRGMNKITVFEADGIRVAHFGDIGCELPEELVKALSGLDAAMVPVGGFFTIDAVGALALKEKIRPRVFVPMHYRYGRIGLPQIGTLDDFLALAGGGTRLEEQYLDVTKSAPEGIVVPAFF